MGSGCALPIKKVLMTGDTVGGVWSYTLELSRALARHGVEVHLAVMGRLPSSGQRAEAASIPNLRLYESNYKLEWMDEPWRDLGHAGSWLLTLEHLVDPDIVHLNGFVHGILPWQRSFFIVGHSCVLSWLEATGGSCDDLQWAEYRKKVTQGLQNSPLVVAPTQAMLSSLQSFYGPFRKTCVVPNGRDPGMFRPGLKEPYIFSAGRLWDKAKNIMLLDLVGAEIDWPVFIAGDTSHPCGASNTYRHIQCLGKLSSDEISARLSTASIYVSPARYEPFGLSILEAALAGCALVLSDIASLREIWGDSALYIHPERAATLRDALSFLIRHPEERIRLSRRSRERALTFSSKKMADHYMALYTTLISLSVPPDQKAFGTIGYRLPAKHYRQFTRSGCSSSGNILRHPGDRA